MIPYQSEFRKIIWRKGTEPGRAAPVRTKGPPFEFQTSAHYHKTVSQLPLAYHITFGTYGTRLHGDQRGTVDRRVNGYGDPIVGSDPSWWEQERDRLRFDPILLND